MKYPMKIVLWTVLILAVLRSTAFPAAAEQSESVRPAVLAGTWYPRDPAALRTMIRDFLDRVSPAPASGRIRAIVVPHAGYIYSGPVAAHAFALLQGRSFDTVVLIGPAHRQGFPGVSVNRLDYETPLGRVPVDQELADRIIDAAGPMAGSRPDVHAEEHCLEIELPFLQVVLGQIKMVPVVMGSHDRETCHRLAEAVAAAVSDRNVLLLASTDLSHFHSGTRARELDRTVLDRVGAFDPEELFRDLEAGRGEACGGAPLVTVMLAARALGARDSRVLSYAHSGEVTGDNRRVVGYMAAVLTDGDAHRSPTAGVDPGLNEEDRKTLLTIARQSITAVLNGESWNLPKDLPDAVMTPRGVFVTIKRHGELRGCIGRIVADLPLAKAVGRMAVQAAFYDPRFPPLKSWELDGLSLEISVLTPLEPTPDVEAITVGVHGLLVVQGHHQGLLLPQVPVENDWNKEEFLAHTCRKAGLPANAWKDGAQLYRFSAQVFGEEASR